MIVEPRFRACGVGTALVRAYLREPLTCATEAVAAMGQVCPLFERAGMTPIRMAQRPQDGRLERVLTSREISPEQLADRAGARLLWSDPDIARELRMWANASRRTRKLLDAPPEELARHAARALLAEPVAYVAHAADVDFAASAPSAPSTTPAPSTTTAPPTRAVNCSPEGATRPLPRAPRAQRASPG